MRKIISHPIFKIVGISVILYYGLLTNKKGSNNLSSRLSSENVSSNFSEMSHKSLEIMQKLEKAEQLKGRRPKKEQLEQAKDNIETDTKNDKK